MSGRGWLSSRAALGALGGGALLLAGGCAFIYDFQDNYSDATGTGGGTATGAGSEAVTSSSSMSGGTGGAGGAPCTSGPTCGIEPLIEEPEGKYGEISLGVSRVFWARSGGLYALDKDPSSMTEKEQLVSDTVGVIHVAAVDDMIIYFATAKDVTQYDVSNDAALEVMMNTNPTGLTLHMGYAYWPSTADGMIHKGKPMDTSSIGGLIGTSPYLISASGGENQVYWTYLGSDPPMSTGGVKRLNEGDVAIDQNLPTGIAADGEDVYWITREGKIHKYSFDDGQDAEAGPPFLDVNIMITSGRVAVSDTHVYWLGPDSTSCKAPCVCQAECGAVLRLPKDDFSQQPEVFADLDWPVLKGLAVDRTQKYVYWTTGDAESKLLRKAFQ